MTVLEAILKYNPELTAEDAGAMNDAAKAVASRLGIAVQPGWGLGKIQIEIFEATAEAAVTGTYVYYCLSDRSIASCAT